MFCFKCGKELEEGDVFCPKCGTKVLIEKNIIKETSKKITELVDSDTKKDGIQVDACQNDMREIQIENADSKTLKETNESDSERKIKKKKYAIIISIICAVIAIVIVLVAVVAPLYSYAYKINIADIQVGIPKGFSYNAGGSSGNTVWSYDNDSKGVCITIYYIDGYYAYNQYVGEEEALEQAGYYDSEKSYTDKELGKTVFVYSYYEDSKYCSDICIYDTEKHIHIYIFGWSEENVDETCTSIQKSLTKASYY